MEGSYSYKKNFTGSAGFIPQPVGFCLRAVCFVCLFFSAIRLKKISLKRVASIQHFCPYFHGTQPTMKPLEGAPLLPPRALENFCLHSSSNQPIPLIIAIASPPRPSPARPAKQSAISDEDQALRSGVSLNSINECPSVQWMWRSVPVQPSIIAHRIGSRHQSPFRSMGFVGFLNTRYE